MMAAQDAVVKRTVSLMETKASQFMKLIQASLCPCCIDCLLLILLTESKASQFMKKIQARSSPYSHWLNDLFRVIGVTAVLPCLA